MSKYHLSTPIGVHRLLKKPYDDSEIFYNTSDFINYLKNGAGYDGQIVKVLIGKYDDNIEEEDKPLYTTHPYMQQFMIHNDSAIPIIKNNILNNSNNSILIYNHNSKLSQEDNYIDSDDMYAHYVFDDAFYFSLLNDGMLDILNFNKSINENSKYFSFRYIKHPAVNANPVIEQWSQLYNPFSDESTISTTEKFDDYCEKYYEIFHYTIDNILVLHKNNSDNNSILELVRYSKQNNGTIVGESIYNDILMIKNPGSALNYSYRNIRIEMQVSESIKYINDLNLF